MKTIIRTLVLCMSISLVTTQVHAIRLNTARISAVVGGALLASPVIKESVPVYLLGSTVVGGLLYAVLYQFTPEAKYSSALSKINSLSLSDFAMHEIKDTQSFYQNLEQDYASEQLWLAVSFKELSILIGNARTAIVQLDEARSEARDDILMVKQCNDLLPIAKKAVLNLTDALTLIKKHPQYIEQVSIAKKEQLAREKLAVQREMASAARQSAWAQQRQAMRA